MKKSVLYTLLALVLVFSLWTKISAQTLTSDRAYQDYQFTLTQYEDDYASFTDAKDFYLKNPTLTLKEDARKKTLTMLRSRDQLYIVYLTALRAKIVAIKGLNQDQKGGMFTKIDNEVAWYKGHMDNYQDGDVLEDLFNKSQEAETRYKSDTLPTSYEALFDISLGEQIGIRQDSEEIYSSLKSGVTNPDPYSRWFNDIDSVLTTLKENESKAETQIQKIYTQNYAVASSYKTSVNTLSSSQISLDQLNEFLTELFVAINNQQ